MSGEGGVLTIDLAALRANWLAIAAHVAPARTAAVVKADAYGLGAARVAPMLAAAGCRNFFVAHLGEALALKPLLPPDARLYVLNGLQPGMEATCAQAAVIPVLNSLAQARNWAAHALTSPAALQIDSGMSRLGLPDDELAQLMRERLPLHLVLLMTHLACADVPGDAANAAQLACFEALAARLPPLPRSLANSAGCFLPRAFHGDLVRPGIALYGVRIPPGLPSPIRPVVALDACVVQVRTIPAHRGVGYGLAFRPDAEARIATIAVGYGDGWPRRIGPRGAAWHGGTRLPIAGRVSMDSITLDVTALPAGTLALGDTVELIGQHQSLEQVAADAGTIPYEILTSLGHRYARRWIEA